MIYKPKKHVSLIQLEVGTKKKQIKRAFELYLRRKERTKPKIQEREEDKGALGIQIVQGKKIWKLSVKCVVQIL